MLFATAVISAGVQAQAPQITYGGAGQSYNVGTAITPLVPTNNGGAVTSGFVGVSTFANNGTTTDFYSLKGVATVAAGNVYVADSSNNLIRKVTPAGVLGRCRYEQNFRF